MNTKNKYVLITLAVGSLTGVLANTVNANPIDHRSTSFDLRSSLNCSRTEQDCIDISQQLNTGSKNHPSKTQLSELFPTHVLGDNYVMTKTITERYAARQPIEIETAGTYEIILTDLGFDEDLHKLKLKLTKDGEKPLKIDGSGSMIFDAAPGTYHLSVFANAGWQPNQGAFSISIQPHSVSSVPVPGAAWLFGSGLIGLAGVLRRKVK